MAQKLLTDRAGMVSVDVESAGPNPTDYALLSIGACTLLEPRQIFYSELRPDKAKSEPASEQIHQLDLAQLAREGAPPMRALGQFAAWLEEAVSDPRGPLFLGFNAAFDWMFINDYFLHYLGANPFGHSAVDIKSFIMGLRRIAWDETRMASFSQQTLSHNALEDAQHQADLFLGVLRDAGILDT